MNAKIYETAFHIGAKFTGKPGFDAANKALAATQKNAAAVSRGFGTVAKLTINSSTTRFSPTVRDRGFTSTSSGQWPAKMIAVELCDGCSASFARQVGTWVK